MSTLAEILKGLKKGERYQSPKDRYGFYSPTEEGIVNAPLRKGQGKQWFSELSKQEGVTKSELQDAGLIDYLETTEGPITKEMVFDYFQANRPQMKRMVGEVGGPKPMPVAILPHDLPPMQVNRGIVDDPRRLKNQTLMDTLRGQEGFGVGRNDPIVKEYLKQYPEAASIVQQAETGYDVRDLVNQWAKANNVETADEFAKRYVSYNMMQNPPRVGTYPDPDPTSRYKSLEIRQNPSQIEVVGMGRNENLQETMHTQPIIGWSPEAKEKNLVESLRSGIMQRNRQRVDSTRHSAWAKPLNPETYREELFYTPPKDGEPYTTATAHWGDIPNPTAHNLSETYEIEGGLKAVGLIESQADTQIAAHKAGGWAPTQQEIKAARGNRDIASDKMIDAENVLNETLDENVYAENFLVHPSKNADGEITDDVLTISDEIGHSIAEIDTKTGKVTYERYGKALGFDRNEPALIDWAKKVRARDAAEKAEDKLMANVSYPQRVPLSREGKSKGVKGRAMEWEKFNLKRLLQRAVDENADGIMIPNSEELVAKYGRGEDGGQEKAYKKFYDKNIPQEWQKYMKQFDSFAPEVREGPDGVKRLFLPMSDKLRNEINTRGLPMYGKRGLADVLGEQYV